MHIEGWMIEVGIIAVISFVVQLSLLSSDPLSGGEGGAKMLMVGVVAVVSLLGVFLVYQNRPVTTHTHTVAYVQHKSQSHNQGG